MPKNTLKSEKDLILEAALPHISFNGWSDSTLRDAEKDTGLPSDQFFPRGAFDLALHFSDWADRQMLKALEEHDISDMRVRDRITLGVRTRFECLEVHKDALRQSLHFMALPPRNFKAPKMIWATADHIWEWAGDTSTDYNRYTKRGLLSGVITATTLYWLEDVSDNHQKTWDFLDDRISNVLKLGQFVGKTISKFKKVS